MEGLPYFGTLSRATAEDILLENGTAEGAFFLRDRPEQVGEFVLVLLFQGRPTHHLVRCGPNGVWTVNNRAYGEPHSLQELIAILSKPNPVWPIVLSQPLSKPPGLVIQPAIEMKRGSAAAAQHGAPLLRSNLTPASVASEELVLPRRAPAPQAPTPAISSTTTVTTAPALAASTRATPAATASATKGSEHSGALPPYSPHSPADMTLNQGSPSSIKASDSQLRGSAPTHFSPAAPFDEDPPLPSIPPQSPAVRQNPQPSPDRTQHQPQQPRPHSALSTGAVPDDQWTADEDFPSFVHGPISRTHADDLLRGPDGTFLFRERPESTQEYVLSVVFRGKPTHHLVHWSATGYLNVNGKQFGTCATFAELVSQLNSEPEERWPVRLIHPVPCSDEGAAASSVSAHPASQVVLTVPQSRKSQAEEALPASELPAHTTVINTGAPAARQPRPSAPVQATPTVANTATTASSDPAALLRRQPVPLTSEQPSSRSTSRPVSARLSAAEEEIAFWSIEDDAISLHSTHQSSVRRADSAAATADVCATMIVTGRRGYASIINGVYERCGDCHGRPAYRKADAQPMFLFYHLNNKSWAIAGLLGSNEVACYSPDTCATPAKLRQPWRVSDVDGLFVEDLAVCCLTGNERISEFRQVLQQLTHVHATGARFPQHQLGELCKELRSHSCRIVQLKLFDNQLHSMDVKNLMDALKLNRSVTHLQLRMNNIGDNEAAMVADMLASNPCVLFLSLRENSITDRGARDFADALRANRSLLGISLWGNELTDDGAAALVEVLRDNKTLRGLRLFHNRAGSSVLRRIQLRGKHLSPRCVIEISPPRGSSKRRSMF